MTIHLPKDVENAINAEVLRGQFASADDAVAEIVREYFRRQEQTPTPGTDFAAEVPDPLLGSMRDYADEMDEIVADAMKRRREEPWRALSGE
jgi:Arc/MetJ-type ribon-helix-helix transcriptional regulator